MSENIESRILEHLGSGRYKPMKPRSIARELDLHHDESYPEFRTAFKRLVGAGRVALGPGRVVVLPDSALPKNEQPTHLLPQALPHGIVVGSYRHNRRGFGFVMPTQPAGHEDLFIPPGMNLNAITGDVVRAKVSGSEQRDGKLKYEGRILEIISRTNSRFVGTLVKQGGQWMMLPDGNEFTEPILTPDASSRHIKAGTKVVVELTEYPEDGQHAQGVITDVLGKAGEKDVDLKSVIVQYNLPTEFPEGCRVQARAALDRFNATIEEQRSMRLDLTDELICTIDPDDAKDYDDAISLTELDNGNWELGVHIADVSFFVESGSPLDEEAQKRGNSAYFPGFVIPMLPEILSNGVCSLQEGVPRLCKSVFIEIDAGARPVATRFANSVIKSAKRLRYREAQAIIEGADAIPHPDGAKKPGDYPKEVVELLQNMDRLAKRVHKRRLHDGQLVLGLPEVDLILDEEGKVIGAAPEDQSFTHTVIEMFMVEANEAVARLLDGLDVPFIRRAHAEPDPDASDRLRAFVNVAGYKLPKTIDRKALQSLLATVKDRPEAFAINLAVLKSLSRAEYSPEAIGHYALASEYYCHFTSPIRRYADLLVHRLLDSYFAARDAAGIQADHVSHSRKKKLQLDNVIAFEDLAQIGQHISFTERRADDAENELREVKLLELLSSRLGDEFDGVVASITKFGVFIQIQEYLIDGLIRFEEMADDYWDADDRSGVARGRRTGRRIAVGDACKVIVASVDVPRRELKLAFSKFPGAPKEKGRRGHREEHPKQKHRTGKPYKGKPSRGHGSGAHAPRSSARPKGGPRKSRRR
jgi:ribonuclease R